MPLVGASQVVLVVKNPPASIGEIRDVSLISWLGRSPGRGNGNTLQYCLENSVDRGALGGYSPWGGKEPDMTEQIHTCHL